MLCVPFSLIWHRRSHWYVVGSFCDYSTKQFILLCVLVFEAPTAFCLGQKCRNCSVICHDKCIVNVSWQCGREIPVMTVDARLSTIGIAPPSAAVLKTDEDSDTERGTTGRTDTTTSDCGILHSIAWNTIQQCY